MYTRRELRTSIMITNKHNKDTVSFQSISSGRGPFGMKLPNVEINLDVLPQAKTFPNLCYIKAGFSLHFV